MFLGIIKILRKSICIILTMCFVMTNTSYARETLRLPVGELKDERTIEAEDPIGVNLDKALKGDKETYSKIKQIDPKKMLEYFEKNIKETVANLPEDLFGFGFGYDIRGNVLEGTKGNINITPRNMYAFGKLLALKYFKAGDSGLITGDGRIHTPILRYSLALGMASVGVQVDFSEDTLTTGAHNVNSAENAGNYKFQIQISGSHGVYQKNGAKIKIDYGRGKLDPFYGRPLSEIWEKRNDILKTAASVDAGKLQEAKGVLDAIIKMYVKTLPAMNKDEILVLDTRAGNAGEMNQKFFTERGFKVINMDEVLGVKGVPDADIESLLEEKKDKILSVLKEEWGKGNRKIVFILNMDSDPYMRRGIWDPSKAPALVPSQKLVSIINSNLTDDMPQCFGGVYDGDADRFGAIKENGEAIPVFEMTILYYQRFLLDPKNIDAIVKIVKAGGEPLWLACDVRTNSKLEKVLKNINEIIKKKADLKQDVIKAMYINTGYPPQISFVEWRIEKMRQFIEDTPSLKNDDNFMQNFKHLAETYYTAEASGHNFFHVAPDNPERPCDCGMAALVAEVNIRETIGEVEREPLGLKQKENYTLVELYDAFPQVHTSSELRLPILPNSVKLETAHRLGKWLEEKYQADLKYTEFSKPLEEGEILLQPVEDGMVKVAGYKAQLKNGDAILIRWSNTGEEIQLIFEGHTIDALIARMQEVADRMKEEEKVGLDRGDLLEDIENIKQRKISVYVKNELDAINLEDDQKSAILQDIPLAVRALEKALPNTEITPRLVLGFLALRSGLAGGFHITEKEDTLYVDNVEALKGEGSIASFNLAVQSGETPHSLGLNRITVKDIRSLPFILDGGVNTGL